MKFLVHPVNTGLAPIDYKYFERNMTLYHFLLSRDTWNISVNNPYSDVITKTIKSHHIFFEVIVYTLRLFIHLQCLYTLSFIHFYTLMSV